MSTQNKYIYMSQPTPNTERLLHELEGAINSYAKEDSTYQDVELVDIYLVGSVFTEDFKPNRSDLDIVVVLKNTEQTGVIAGFDTYLREDRQNNLVRASEMPVSKVDVGVYCSDTYHNHIDDQKAYSCKYNRSVDI